MTKKLTRGTKKASVASKVTEEKDLSTASEEKVAKKRAVSEEKVEVKESSTAEKLVGTLHEGKKIVHAVEKVLNEKSYVEVTREDRTTALVALN